MTQARPIYYCTNCDKKHYRVGKVKKIGKCPKCGKESKYALLVEV